MNAVLHSLPALDAFLNGLSAVFIVIGFIMIKRRKKETHKRFMLAATATSAIFLVSYLIKSALLGTTYYGGEGASRVVYLSVLFTHLVLAMAVVPLVGIALWHGLRSQFEKHRRIVKWTLPVWLYVSVTGVVVYVMLRPYY